MRIHLIACGALAALCATSALAGSDNFNRANLDHKWGFLAGSLFIVNNELQGTSGAEGIFIDADALLAQSATAKVILHGAGLQYGAITVGSNTDLNAFVKIQSQGGTGLFDHVGFYTGNNGDGVFVAMTSPMSSPATMTVSLFASVAVLTVKSASGTQVYTHDYGAFLVGTGVGTFGAVSLDNFTSPTILPPAAAAAPFVQPVAVVGSNAVDLTR